jgi:hypothetical protein
MDRQARTTARKYRRCSLVALLLGAFSVLPAQGEPLPAKVEFNRDIRPILSDMCFQCHGPDRSKRRADLRLDLEENAFADRGGGSVLVPGRPDQSVLYQRISAAEPARRMPPVKSGARLSANQIDLVRRWIEQGAALQKHWSLLPPQRCPPPVVKDRAWVRNPVDAFILARLERDGLTPAPEASRSTLLRRVSLDLTGLPPTPAEADAFLADAAPDAYEKVVDRLLGSPRYGERLAIRWLDAARYADTNGYQNDGERYMWRWRDWVIDAFNRNLHFDQFTTEQLAGDLLPQPTLEQRIATGFNRNHRGNAEGGIIPEEYAVEYVVDRVETTATVWLGLTLGCARCHDHKYDPIQQKEFYQVFAFFNNVPENGKAVKYGNSPPMIKAPTHRQQEQLAQVESQLALAEEQFRQRSAALAAAQVKWERTYQPAAADCWTITKGLLAHCRLDGNGTDGRFQGGLPRYSRGPTGQAADFDGRRFLDCGDIGDFGYFDKFSCGAWIYPRGSHGGAILSRMTDTSQSEGYNLHLEQGKVQVNLVKRWLDDAIRVETVAVLAPDHWYHVQMTYDGSRLAQGIKIYVNGMEQKLKVHLDELNQSFETKEPLRIGSRGTGSRFVGAIQDVRVYRRVLSPDEVQVVMTPERIGELLALPPASRSLPQDRKLRAYFLECHAPLTLQQLWQRLGALREARQRLFESIPTSMVMEERPVPQDTFVLLRGAYDKRGEKVLRGVPACLPPFPGGLPRDRLGLARWMMSPEHPLTARVTVNRFWQMLFGTGLVKTVDDFGSQGEWPTHPELLDWLATEFIRSDWNVKATLRLLVTSATYRQASKAPPSLLRKDPENRLLARGPRVRLSAEMIRDQALAVSGLLVERVGGPSVKPYQPPGLWKELTGTEDYVQDHGANLYRRSLYTFWKRTVAPPAMITFDAAGREACIVRETRTNTPLQALTLLNDVTYVEAARVLAQRVLREAKPGLEDRLTLIFRLAVGRRPQAQEMRILEAGLLEYLARFRADPAAARELVSVGESMPGNPQHLEELAAYTAIAELLLNLDEVITKG